MPHSWANAESDLQIDFLFRISALDLSVLQHSRGDYVDLAVHKGDSTY